MYNSNDVYQILEILKSISSSKEKLIALREFMKTEPGLVKVLQLAYDPEEMYGVKQIPEIRLAVGGREFNKGTLLLLDKLSNGILTGHAARDAVANEMSELCTESGQLLHNILKKDLRCGFNVKTINAAIPNTIFHQPYMRCSIYEDGCISFPVHSQCKADGSYLSLTRLNEGGFDLRTRKGKKYPNDTFWEDILMSASKLFKGQQLHGELQVLRNGNLLSRKEANGILNSVRLGALLPTDCE